MENTGVKVIFRVFILKDIHSSTEFFVLLRNDINWKIYFEDHKMIN